MSRGALGCRPNSDTRNARYRVTGISTPRTVRWSRYIPVIDQVDVGSCVGQAYAGALGSHPLWSSVPEKIKSTLRSVPRAYGEGIYSAATAIDPYEGTWPPDDTGTDTRSGAQVLLSRKLITRYEWIENDGDPAATVRSIVGALAERPVVIGIPWLDSFDWPDKDGLIRITVGATVRGGHALIVDECNVTTGEIGITNSWGPSWGVEGRCYMTWETLAEVLSMWGDACVPIYVAPGSESASRSWWRRILDWLW